MKQPNTFPFCCCFPRSTATWRLAMAVSRHALPYLLCLILTGPSLPVRADIYRRVDKYGVEHYTNVQPRGGGWQRVIRSKATKVRQRKARQVSAPDPKRLSRYDSHIAEAAARYQLPPAFIRAVVRVESNFYEGAVSHKGAMGLMQLMPGTAAHLGVEDPFDPRQNVLGGSRYLRLLANRLDGDLLLTIAAYNAGLGAVRRHEGVPPFTETRRYVRNVLQHYHAFKQEELAERNAAADDARASAEAGPSRH